MTLDDETRERLRQRYVELLEIEAEPRMATQQKRTAEVARHLERACTAWDRADPATRSTLAWLAYATGSPLARGLELEATGHLVESVPVDAIARKIDVALRDLTALFALPEDAFIDEGGRPRQLALRWLIERLKEEWERTEGLATFSHDPSPFEQFAEDEVDRIDAAARPRVHSLHQQMQKEWKQLS